MFPPETFRAPDPLSMSADFCIVMPAYKAEKVLAATVARLPAELAERKGVLLIIDDGCPDGTGRVADELAAAHAWIEVIHHAQNRGYGGAQKTGLQEGLRRGCRGFAIVHADGQYAPEQVLDLLAPILSGEADLVQGSRLLSGSARAGGMPLVRYLANRTLTAMENLAFGTRLAEFHSGYMLYSRRLLEALPFASLQDNFNFDAEIILLAHLAGFPCRELPIPTHYGEESSSLDPIPYGVNVLKMIGRHWVGHYDRLLRETPRTAPDPAPAA